MKNILVIIITVLVLMSCGKDSISPVQSTPKVIAIDSTLNHLQGNWYFTHLVTNSYLCDFYTGTTSRIDFTMTPSQNLPGFYESLGIINGTNYPSINNYQYIASQNSINNLNINNLTNTDLELEFGGYVSHYKRQDWTPTTIEWSVDFDVYPSATPNSTGEISLSLPPFTPIYIALVPGQLSYSGIVNYDSGITYFDISTHVSGTLDSNVTSTTKLMLDDVLVAEKIDSFESGTQLIPPSIAPTITFKNI